METIGGIKQELFSSLLPDRVEPVSTVMIIDDNIDIIAAMTALLQPTYRVIPCLNHEEALTRLTRDVRVVLLDIKMAGKDGIEVFTLLKQQRPDLRIIFHSAYPGSSEKAVKVERLHHNGYLTKGDFTARELLTVIERAFDESERQASRSYIKGDN
jgi:DNA-binding NtrC family response regulator